MRHREAAESTFVEGKRMLNIREAAAYLGLGTTTTRTWLAEIGAKRSFGTRSLYDKNIIDNALDAMQAPTIKEV